MTSGTLLRVSGLAGILGGGLCMADAFPKRFKAGGNQQSFKPGGTEF